MRTIKIVFSLLPLILFLGPGRASEFYQATKLPPISPIFGEVGINQKGEVVGEIGSSNTQAALILPRPTYGLPEGLTRLPAVWATSINNQGYVVGMVDTSEINPTVLPHQAYIWSPAKGDQPQRLQVLPSLGEAWPEARAYDINEKNQICGISGIFREPTVHAVVWEPDGDSWSIRTLGMPRGIYSWARAINNKGQVVGFIDYEPDRRGFLWLPQADYGLAAGLTEFGIEGDDVTAVDINDRGQILLHFRGRQDRSALWFPEPFGGYPAGLNLLENYQDREVLLTAINNMGQCVGNAGGFSTQALAVIWEKGQYRQINHLISQSTPTSVFGAAALNDYGQIVAFSDVGVFLLTPSDFQEPDTPVLVFPWLSENHVFSSALSLVNRSRVSQYLELTATRADGSSAKAYRVVPPLDQWVEGADSMFAPLGWGPGYSVVVKSQTSAISGVTLLSAKNTASGWSPSLDNGQAPALASKNLLFSFPGQSGMEACGLSVTNLGEVETTLVLTLWQDGEAKNTKQVLLGKGKPFAVMVSALFPDSQGPYYVTALGQEPLAGAVFYFNAMGEPAMSAATPIWEEGLE